MKKGKIIAIIGSPRSGKSFLAETLAEHYRAELILEGEEKDIPQRIREDIEKNIRPVERIIWFRNELIKKYLLALKYREEGKDVVLDTFWISSRPYIKPLLKDDIFEENLVSELLSLDEKIMPWPDVALFLDVSDETIKKFIVEGGRKFDASDEFFVEQARPINRDHKRLFSQPLYEGKITKIDRDKLDFKNPEHLKEILDIIDKS